MKTILYHPGRPSLVPPDGCSGFENVYVYVLFTKCMSILCYDIDCLHVDHVSTHVNCLLFGIPAFKWICGISRIEHIRVYLKNCNTTSFKFLLDQRLVCFISNLKHECSSLLSNLLIYDICLINEIRNIMCVCIICVMF